jgi:mannose-6-phosphate isomerase-like protein (cupin superfamily)
MHSRERQRDAQRRQLACMLACPLACAALPLVAIALLMLRSKAPAYPACRDTLAASGAPYVRPFGAPSDYGRPGLSHVTLHGAVHHGAREVEVWQQAFAPGAGTPIHRHACEEVFVVLGGSGTLYARGGDGEVTPLRFTANSTLVVPRDAVHQVLNTGDTLLQLTVIISRPPIQVYVYESWRTPDTHAVLRAPYFWDEACPHNGDHARAESLRGGDLH